VGLIIAVACSDSRDRRAPADDMVGLNNRAVGLMGQFNYDAAREIFGPSIADRAKRGFSIPVHAWIRGPLSELVRDLLSPRSVASLGVLDPARVTSVLEDHMSGRRQLGFELWGLAVLVAWHRMRVARPPDPPPVIEPPRAVVLPPAG